MKHRYCIMLVLLGIFTSCSQKLYQKDDYPFYDKNFTLGKSSHLRTDGVYVLDRIWTGRDGGTEKKADKHRFFKFYAAGQSNSFEDVAKSIVTDEQYIAAVLKDGQPKDHTLFEGYYKLKENKIIIQNRVVPRGLFQYEYGYVEEDMLIIVKATHEGNGSFDDKYFTDYYKEYYVFKPLGGVSDIVPQW